VTHPATLPEMQARYGERYRWRLLLAVMVGTMASIMSYHRLPIERLRLPRAHRG